MNERGGSKDVVRKLVVFEGKSPMSSVVLVSVSHRCCTLELNLIRLVARAVFAGGAVTFGIDALTPSMTVLANPYVMQQFWEPPLKLIAHVASPDSPVTWA